VSAGLPFRASSAHSPRLRFSVPQEASRPGGSSHPAVIPTTASPSTPRVHQTVCRKAL
jgi:hypothetical protein